jgi:hypothetical protein
MERRPTRKWLGVHCAHLAVTTNLQPNTASPSTEITLHLESGQSQQTENLFVFCEFDFIACDHTNNHTTVRSEGTRLYPRAYILPFPPHSTYCNRSIASHRANPHPFVCLRACW